MSAGIKRRRLRWNADLGPWGNGFDHGWRDGLRGVDFPEPAASHPIATDTEREAYTGGYHEARAVLRGAGDLHEGGAP